MMRMFFKRRTMLNSKQTKVLLIKCCSPNTCGLAKVCPGSTSLGCCKCKRTPPYHALRVDIDSSKSSISSAVDVMQVMGSSVCSVLPKKAESRCLLPRIRKVPRIRARIIVGVASGRPLHM